MTKERVLYGGGTLSPDLCTLPKGGVAHDRAKYGCSMPVQDRRLPADREPDESGHELARNKLGAAAGPHADGCERYLPRGQRGRRGTAYADGGRDASPQSRRSHWVWFWISWIGICSRRHKQTEFAMEWDICNGRRPTPQQPAALSRGVHLASDSLSSPERGCAA